MARVQNLNAPMAIWQANFDTGAGVGRATSWYSFEDRVLSWDHKVGKQHELGISEAGTGSVVMWDRLEYLNPANTGSPYNSGGNQLKPYRQIRHAEMWSLTGNIINSTNNVWGAPYGFAGSYGDSSSFEGGTVGNWIGVGTTTVANSTSQAHDGTHSMLVTWPAHTGAGSPATVAATTVGVPMRGTYTYTLSMWIWITSGPAVTIRCNAGSATSTSTTGAWQRVSTTFTCADQLGETISVSPSGTTTAGQNIFVDSVQLEVAGSASTYTTSGPTVYPMWWGYIERYPKTWRFAGFDGLCSLTIIDDLTLASKMPMDSALVSQMLMDNPYFYWKLNETGLVAATVYGQRISNIVDSGSSGADTRWVDIGGGNAAVGFGGTCVFGDNTSPDLDNQSSVRFTVVSGFGRELTALWPSASAPGGVVGGLTWTFCFRIVDIGTSAGLVYMYKTGGTVYNNFRYLSGSGVQYNNASGGYTPATASVADSEWHHAAIVLSNNGTTTTHTMYLDGLATVVGPTTEATLPSLTFLSMGLDEPFKNIPLNGNIAHVAVYPVALSAATIMAQAQASSRYKAFQGQLPGQRMAKVVKWAGWASPVNFPDGVGSSEAPVALSGSNMSAELDILAASDGGIVYSAPEGRLTFIPRSAYYAQTAGVVTFGDDPVGSGDIPYRDGSLQIELDPTYIYNTSKVNRKTNTQTFSTTSVPSHNDYENNDISVTINSLDYVRVSSLADYLILLYGDGRLRVSAIAFNVGANPSIIAAMLARRIGDRVTVRRRAPAFTTLLDFFIEAMTWSSSPETGIIVSMTLEPAHPFQAGLIGTGLIGTLLSTY